MAYIDSALDDPTGHVQAVIYTGNGTARSITFDGSTNMNPDMVWCKIRSQSYSHRLFDKIRGTGKFLHTDTNEAEGTNAQNLSAFNSNGFSLGTDNGTNSNTDTHVAWCWKAGGSTSSNSNGTGITSTVSTNSDAQFSIITWTGSGTVSNTVGHGLSGKPDFVICKNRTTATTNWVTWSAGGTSTKNTALNHGETEYDSTESGWQRGILGNPTATTLTFSAGFQNENNVNQGSANYVAYAWKAVKGYSSFGKYRANDQDGDNSVFVYLGFKPAILLIKRLGSSEWVIVDNKRRGYNDDNDILHPSSNASEDTGDSVSFLSNGFKLQNSTGELNYSTQTMLYMAWAEAPLVTSTGLPTTAG